MATHKPTKQPRRRKASETVRERSEKERQKKLTKSQGSKLKSKLHGPFSRLGKSSKKQPKSEAPKKRHFHLMPKYIRESWGELRKVTWPTKNLALRLTGAVVIFSIVFAIFVQITDLIFNKLIKIIILE